MKSFNALLAIFLMGISLVAQNPMGQDSVLHMGQDSVLHMEHDSVLHMEQDSVHHLVVSSGWADEAVTIGFITAPSVLGLMFVSALVNEWNAGYAGIPASLMILAAPPLIFAGGRSVNIPREISNPKAKLGWTLYAISIIPTSLALYGFTTDWGATLPLTIASGVLGSGSIVAMTTYAFSRDETARKMVNESAASWNFGVAPLVGGALATVTFTF
jgi:hypothetical protein